jgi:hypothetical protein
MIVESIGSEVQSSTLNSGDCFLFNADRPRLAMLTTDDHGHKATLILSDDGERRVPWVHTNALPKTVFAVPNALIRPDWSTLAFGTASELGAITSTAGGFYLRSAFQKVHVVVINLNSGVTEDPPASSSVLHFTRWSAGIVFRDNEWLPLAGFPEI